MSDDAPIPAPRRTIALVGLMGVGKSTVGRRLARRLHLPFADGDAEIEAAAGMTVSEIFAELGEPEFRAGEARVMRRLLQGERRVLATGGGAILNPETTRPLLRGRDPLEALEAMAAIRYPIYATADVTVDVAGGAHADAVEAIVSTLEAFWAQDPSS